MELQAPRCTDAMGQQDPNWVRSSSTRSSATPVPLDMNILKALKRSSLGLDLYLWLTYRTFSLKHTLQLPWKRLYRQFGADPAKAGDRTHRR